MKIEQELAEAYDKIARLEAEVRLLRTQLWLAEKTFGLQEEDNRLWAALVDAHQERMAALIQHEQPPMQDVVTLRLVDLIR